MRWNGPAPWTGLSSVVQTSSRTGTPAARPDAARRGLKGRPRVTRFAIGSTAAKRAPRGRLRLNAACPRA